MKRTFGLLLLVSALSPWVSAQDKTYSEGHGYAFFAPGGTSPSAVALAHVGVGAEGFFTRYLGFGMEGGYVTPIRHWSYGIGTFSPDFVVRFRAKDKTHKIEPFVAGGYTLFFRSGTANGFNYGVGVNYWVKNRLGLRFEVRDNVWTSGGVLQHIGFRIGVTF